MSDHSQIMIAFFRYFWPAPSLLLSFLSNLHQIDDSSLQSLVRHINNLYILNSCVITTSTPGSEWRWPGAAWTTWTSGWSRTRVKKSITPTGKYIRNSIKTLV